MVELHDFITDWTRIEHGTTMFLEFPASYKIHIVAGQWKGVTTVGQGWDEKSGVQGSNDGSGWGYASCLVPALDKYSWFEGGYIKHTATNMSGHTGTLYMNNVNMGTVMDGGGKLVDYEMPPNAPGITIQTVGSLVPAGQVWCTVLATLVYGYRRPITQYFYTTDPGFIINDDMDYRAQYIGMLANKQETPWKAHTNPALFQPGIKNKITLGVSGSKYADFRLGIRYEVARPVPLMPHTITLPDGSTKDLPLVAVNDPSLDYGDILSFVLPDGSNRARYAADLVATDDEDATEFRVSTHLGILSWRKWV